MSLTLTHYIRILLFLGSTTNYTITTTHYCRGNLILKDCLEDRVIHSRDYVRPGPGPGPDPSESVGGNVVVAGQHYERRVVTRKLQQAMIPGPELVRVQQVQLQVQMPGFGVGQQQQRLSSPIGTPSSAAANNNQAIHG